MLNLGCGTLRGGCNYIKFLNTGNYYIYSIDISPKAIAYGKNLIQQEWLAEKTPY